MTISDSTRQNLEVVSGILIRVFLYGLGLLLLAGLPIMLLGDQVYAVHHTFFAAMSKEQHGMLMFSWLGNLKLLLIMFFLLPWLAIRSMLKQATGA